MILSILIIMFILSGIILGIKRGFTYQLIKMLSLFITVVGALFFKNIVAKLFINYFDFLDMNPHIKIIFYRGIAFILLCFIIRIIIGLLLKISKKFEKLLNATIILGIPSKILGGILGFIEFYIYAFIILLILSIPIFKVNVKNSKVANIILNNTPTPSKKVDTELLDELQDTYNSCHNDCEEKYIKILNKHGIVAKEKDMD